MKTLTCDICTSVIHTPVNGRNYHHVAHRDICEPCHDKLGFLLRPIIRTKAPFTYDWFSKVVQESIEKAIVKGKIDVK